MATGQKCAHQACQCNVQPPQQYCSPQCQQQSQQSQQGGQRQMQAGGGAGGQQAGARCNCGHAACQHA